MLNSGGDNDGAAAASDHNAQHRKFPSALQLQIRFKSALTYSSQQAAAYPYTLPAADNHKVQSGEPYRNFIRKEQCR